MEPLPLAGTAPRLRADAARNREKVLAAAERLFAEHGVEHVSMDAIAAAAGVGKGTLFRGFGDRAGLALALLSDRESAFQEQLIRGAPPLGPGAPPAERLVAFGQGLLEFAEQHGDLLLAAQSGAPCAHYLSPPYLLQRAHVAHLLHEADPALDADVVADLLLGALGAQLVRHLRSERALDPARIADAWAELVRRVLA